VGTTGYGKEYIKHQEWVQQDTVQHIQNTRSGYNRIRYSIYKTKGVGTTGYGTAYTNTRSGYNKIRYSIIIYKTTGVGVQQDAVQHIQNNSSGYTTGCATAYTKRRK